MEGSLQYTLIIFLLSLFFTSIVFSTTTKTNSCNFSVKGGLTPVSTNVKDLSADIEQVAVNEFKYILQIVERSYGVLKPKKDNNIGIDYNELADIYLQKAASIENSQQLDNLLFEFFSHFDDAHVSLRFNTTFGYTIPGIQFEYSPTDHLNKILDANPDLNISKATYDGSFYIRALDLSVLQVSGDELFNDVANNSTIPKLYDRILKINGMSPEDYRSSCRLSFGENHSVSFCPFPGGGGNIETNRSDFANSLTSMSKSNGMPVDLIFSGQKKPMLKLEMLGTRPDGQYFTYFVNIPYVAVGTDSPVISFNGDAIETPYSNIQESAQRKFTNPVYTLAKQQVYTLVKHVETFLNFSKKDPETTLPAENLSNHVVSQNQNQNDVLHYLADYLPQKIAIPNQNAELIAYLESLDGDSKALVDKALDQPELLAEFTNTFSTVELKSLANTVQMLNGHASSKVTEINKNLAFSFNQINTNFNLQSDIPTGDTAPIPPNSNLNGEYFRMGLNEPTFKIPNQNTQWLEVPAILKTILMADQIKAGVTIDKNGKKMGILRLPTYSIKPEYLSTAKFALRFYLAHLNQISDYIVVDQANNGGGYVSYADFFAQELSHLPEQFTGETDEQFNERKIKHERFLLDNWVRFSSKHNKENINYFSSLADQMLDVIAVSQNGSLDEKVALPFGAEKAIKYYLMFMRNLALVKDFDSLTKSADAEVFITDLNAFKDHLKNLNVNYEDQWIEEYNTLGLFEPIPYGRTAENFGSEAFSLGDINLMSGDISEQQIRTFLAQNLVMLVQSGAPVNEILDMSDPDILMSQLSLNIFGVDLFKPVSNLKGILYNVNNRSYSAADLLPSQILYVFQKSPYLQSRNIFVVSLDGSSQTAGAGGPVQQFSINSAHTSYTLNLTTGAMLFNKEAQGEGSSFEGYAYVENIGARPNKVFNAPIDRSVNNPYFDFDNLADYASEVLFD